MRALLFILCACSFEVPSDTVDAVAEYSWLQTLPPPGPRPIAFTCTISTPLGNLTVSGDEPGVTTFALDGTVAETVRHEEVASVDLPDGTDVVLVGDLLVVGGEWIRLEDCDG